jgi:hypothetical protein
MKRRAQVTIVARRNGKTSGDPPNGAMRMSLSDTLVGKCDRRLDCPSFIGYSRAFGDAVIIEGSMHAMRERLLPFQARFGVRGGF